MARKRAGDLRRRVRFYKLVVRDDGYGNTEAGYSTDPEFTVWASIVPRLGGEQVLADRLSGRNLVNITVRQSNLTTQINESWKAKDADDVEYNIRSIIDPFERPGEIGAFLELLAEKGVAIIADAPVIGPGADTQAKRMGAVDIPMPWRTILPVPDGTIDAGDRKIAARMYPI